MVSKKSEYRKIYDILVKITKVFNDFYIFKNGNCISLDVEKPFLIILKDSSVDEFKKLLGDFKIIKITSVAKFKKGLTDKDMMESSEIHRILARELKYGIELTPEEEKQLDDAKEQDFDKFNDIVDEIYESTDYNDYWHNVTSKEELQRVTDLVELRLRQKNSFEKWEEFVLSDDENLNNELLTSIFKNNEYVNFKPVDTENSPEIILTKSILPLVSEKNFSDLWYASGQVEDNVFIIIFAFYNIPTFDLYMYHHYIPM